MTAIKVWIKNWYWPHEPKLNKRVHIVNFRTGVSLCGKVTGMTPAQRMQVIARVENPFNNEACPVCLRKLGMRTNKAGTVRELTELLTSALALSGQINIYVNRATACYGLENLSAQDRTILLRLINKRKPKDAEEAGALAVLKHIASRKGA